MEIGARYAGNRLRDALGKVQEEITVDENGWATFHCGPGSVSVWQEVMEG
jgi:alpha-amylase